MIEGLKQAVKDGIKEAFADIGKDLAGALVEAIYSITLFGSAISIIIYAAGYTRAIKIVGPLLVAYVLIRYILGGVI